MERRVLSAVESAERDDDRNEPITAAHIATAMDLDRATVAEWAERLVRSGHLLAEPIAEFVAGPPSAPFVKAYRLSPKGRSALEEGAW